MKEAKHTSVREGGIVSVVITPLALCGPPLLTQPASDLLKDTLLYITHAYTEKPHCYKEQASDSSRNKTPLHPKTDTIKPVFNK